MKVREIGEFGLIELLAGMVGLRKTAGSRTVHNLVAGIGDDAAAWKCDGKLTLATTDCLMENAHFRAGQTSWEDLGWKSLAVNLSDIAAMGGSAGYALVTLGLPQDTEVADVASLYKGMLDLAEISDVTIAGGDITSSESIFISLTVTGSATDRVLRRSGARPGDLVALTGYTGLAAAGRRIIEAGMTPSAKDAILRQAFLRPTPRLAEGKLMLAAGAHAAIDVSDGLAADLGHICRASGAGAQITISRIPLHPSLCGLFPAQALDLALGGGEDYELLFTAPENVIGEIRDNTDSPISVIGEITSKDPGRVSLTDASGNEYSLKSAGWDHFGK